MIPRSSHEHAEVVIIGAGLIGSSIAWRLAQSGRKVVLLDRGRPGGEASSAAAGLLVPEAIGAQPDVVRLWLRSMDQYDQFVAEIREVTRAAFDYRICGRLRLALDDPEAETLRQRIPSERDAGIDAEWLAAEDVRKLEPAVNPEVRGALFFTRHGLLDNAMLSWAVAAAAEKTGVEVRPYEPALRIELSGGRIEGVITSRGRIATNIVVNAAGCWSSALTPWRPDVVVASKGEMIALQVGSRPIERIISTSIGTVSARTNGRLIVGATRFDGLHDRTITADAVARMLTAAKTAIPTLGQAQFQEAWAGLRPCPIDKQPIMGQDEVEGLYWATGHLGMGILAAPATAEVMADLINDRPAPIPIDSLSPRRFARTTEP